MGELCGGDREVEFLQDLKNDQKLKCFSNESILRRIYQVELFSRNFSVGFSARMKFSKGNSQWKVS